MRRFQGYIALVLPLLAVFYSGLSKAEDYYWIISFPSDDTRYPSALAACSANREYYLSTTGNSLVSTDYRFTADGRGYYCYIQLRRPDSSQYWTGNVADRRGIGCTFPAVYNPDTGACEAPEPDQCESTIGNVVHHEFRFASLGSDGNPSADPPVTVCKSGCQYSHTFGDFSSKRDFGPPDQLVGSFEYKGNGVSCTPSANDPSVFDQPPAKDPVTKAPEYAINNDCSGWETQPDGTLKRNCTANTSYVAADRKLTQ